jgi:hypothetical protein
MTPETGLALVEAVQATGESSTELERAVVDLLDGQAAQLAAINTLGARVSKQSGEMQAIREGQERIEERLDQLLQWLGRPT